MPPKDNHNNQPNHTAHRHARVVPITSATHAGTTPPTTAEQTIEDNFDAIYKLCGLHKRGVTREQFRAHPFAVLARFNQTGAPDSIANGYLPLLPAQADVAARINADDDRNE